MGNNYCSMHNFAELFITALEKAVAATNRVMVTIAITSTTVGITWLHVFTVKSCKHIRSTSFYCEKVLSKNQRHAEHIQCSYIAIHTYNLYIHTFTVVKVM